MTKDKKIEKIDRDFLRKNIETYGVTLALILTMLEVIYKINEIIAHLNQEEK